MAKKKKDVDPIEKPQKNTESKGKKKSITEQIQSWVNTGSLFIGLILGILSIRQGFIEYDKYKREVDKGRRIQLNEKMATIIDSLSRNINVQKQILLLQYYGKDALPILLASLDTCDIENEYYRYQLQLTIGTMMAYNEGEEKEILKMINRRFTTILEEQISQGKALNNTLIDKYLTLYAHMALEESTKNIAVKTLEKLKNKLEKIESEIVRKNITGKFDRLLDDLKD